MTEGLPTQPWQCGHEIIHTHPEPCCCDQYDQAGVDWPHLWNTFQKPTGPDWDELDVPSQVGFKQIWFQRMMPTFSAVIQAVSEYDRDRKAMRN